MGPDRRGCVDVRAPLWVLGDCTAKLDVPCFDSRPVKQFSDDFRTFSFSFYVVFSCWLRNLLAWERSYIGMCTKLTSTNVMASYVVLIS